MPTQKDEVEDEDELSSVIPKDCGKQGREEMRGANGEGIKRERSREQTSQGIL